MDFAHGLGTGCHSNRRSQVGKGGEDVEIKGRDDWNWGYLGSYVETQCSGNFQDPMMVSLSRTCSNGDTVPGQASFYNQGSLLVMELRNKPVCKTYNP